MLAEGSIQDCSHSLLQVRSIHFLLSSSSIIVPLYYSGSGLAQLTARTILSHLSVSHPLV